MTRMLIRDTGDISAGIGRALRANNFPQPTIALDVDKHMYAPAHFSLGERSHLPMQVGVRQRFHETPLGVPLPNSNTAGGTS